jgi:hypothetical protein
MWVEGQGKQIRTWNKVRYDFLNVDKTQKAKYVFEEKELFDRFIFRRKVTGRPVDKFWLSMTMLSILQETQPMGWEQFGASNGWCWNFCRRYNITSQCKTDGKSEPRVMREPRIREQHMRYLEIQRAELGLVKDPNWGNFPP